MKRTCAATARTLRACLCVLACLLGAPALAGAPVTLDPVVGAAALDARGGAWLDTSGEVLVDNVAADRNIPWVPVRAGAVHPLRSGQALWFRFSVSEPDDSQRWFLEVPYPGVDRVTLYAADRTGQWTPAAAGDAVPVAQWPLPHRHALLPLPLQPGAVQQFLVRVENAHAFGAPLLFTSERQLLRREQRDALFHGLYFGLACLSVVLAAVAAVTLRDAAFGWCAATVLLVALSQAAFSGIAGLHLWPQSGRWNNVASLALPLLAAGSLLCFFSAVVSLRQRSRRLHALLTAASVACVAGFLAVLLVDPGWRARIMVPGVSLAIVLGIGAVCWAAWRGDRHALWLLAGQSPVLLGAVFPLARTWGLLPINFWSQHALQIGIGLHLPLLLTVLAARSQDRRENHRRIHRLDRNDPATGLINGEVFSDRLVRLIARSQRLRHQSVVLLVDLVNVEQVRRDFDRRSAEEMPLRVAERLLSAARDIDSVARLSAQRFGMLVEGPLTPEEAAAVGPRVVARCLMPFKGKPVELVAQVRVAQTLVPSGGAAGAVLEKLDAVLAAVPAGSKRAVFTIR